MLQALRIRVDGSWIDPVVVRHIDGAWVYPETEVPPPALNLADWSVVPVAVGPDVAEGHITLPEIVATDVNWRASPLDEWRWTQDAGGGSWRMLDELLLIEAFTPGTYANIEVRYRTEGSAWSLESTDQKSFTFTAATVTPDVATLILNLTAGYSATIDLVADGVFVANPTWPMEFRLTDGVNMAHLRDGSAFTFYPPYDAPPGTTETTASAYWQGQVPAPAFPTPLSNVTPPSISGVLNPNQTLTLGGDTWSGTPAQRNYEWLLNGVVDTSAVGPTYTAVLGEITGRVYAWTNNGYEWSRSVAQSATVVVTANTLAFPYTLPITFPLGAPVPLGAREWNVVQGETSTYAAAGMFAGSDIVFSIHSITGAVGSSEFGVFDGVGGQEPFNVTEGPFQVLGGAEPNISIDPATGQLTADATGAPLMSGVIVTVRATNSSGYVDETIEFSVVEFPLKIVLPAGLLLSHTADYASRPPLGLLTTLMRN